MARRTALGLGLATIWIVSAAAQSPLHPIRPTRRPIRSSTRSELPGSPGPGRRARPTRRIPIPFPSSSMRSNDCSLRLRNPTARFHETKSVAGTAFSGQTRLRTPLKMSVRRLPGHFRRTQVIQHEDDRRCVRGLPSLLSSDWRECRLIREPLRDHLLCRGRKSSPAAGDDHRRVEDSGVECHRHPLDEGPWRGMRRGSRCRRSRARRRAPGRDGAGNAEHGDLDEAGAERDHRVGRNHGGALEARGHQQRQQDPRPSPSAADQHAVADRTGREARVADPDLATAKHARSGTLRISNEPITSAAPALVRLV